VATQRRRLGAEAPRAVRRSEALLATRSARVAAADPARLLARGWSITRTASGRAVSSIAALQPGDELVTTVADGVVRSTVAATRTRPDPDEPDGSDGPDDPTPEEPT
jgi:exodeoxyribonuclease VII large subunit